jgi:integrase
MRQAQRQRGDRDGKHRSGGEIGIFWLMWRLYLPTELRPLSKAARDVLQELPRLGELVFPASVGSGEKPMRGFHKIWMRLAARSNLPRDITPHILRHSFASIAADLGFSELTIAALLGHRKASITSKYVHHADAVLLQAADTVADRIAELMALPE